jgi:hypothetical protein
MSNGTTETILYPALLDAIIAVGYRALSIMQQSAAKIQTRYNWAAVCCTFTKDA